VHIGMSLIIGILIMTFRLLNNDAVINNLFIAAGYTYGPLLGLFAFGLFTRISIRDKWVPLVALFSPGLAFIAKIIMEGIIPGYHSGYEILVINGAITILGLLILRNKPRI